MARANPYGLRELQWRFVQEYLVDLNASAAYQRAGYKSRGNAAEAHASRLVRNGKVTAAIQAERNKYTTRVALHQDRILEEIALLSHSDVTHYRIDEHGDLALREGAPPHAMRAVSSLKKRIIPTEHGVMYEVEFKLWNKPASIRMAGEHLGTFRDTVVESSDIQAAQTARQAAVTELHTTLQTIRARHARAHDLGVSGAVPS